MKSEYYATLMGDGKIRALSMSVPARELVEMEIPLTFIEYSVLRAIPLSPTRNGLELSQLQEVINSVGDKIKFMEDKNAKG